MRKSRLAIALTLTTLAMACGGGAEDPAPAADSGGSAEASAPASDTSGGEFMGQPASHWIEQVTEGEDAGARTRAMSALASIGPEVDGVTEAVIGALADGEMIVKTGANQTLTRFGAGITPDLVDTLRNSGDAAVRAGVAPILGNYAADADINTALVEALQFDPDPTVRTAAARGLTVAGADGAAAVPALAESVVQDESPEVRQFAALALGRMGAAAAEAIPALESAEQDPESMVANAARSALRQVRQ